MVDEKELQEVFNKFFKDEEKVDLINETIHRLRRNMIAQHLIDVGLPEIIDDDDTMIEIEACMV